MTRRRRLWLTGTAVAVVEAAALVLALGPELGGVMALVSVPSTLVVVAALASGTAAAGD